MAKTALHYAAERGFSSKACVSCAAVASKPTWSTSMGFPRASGPWFHGKPTPRPCSWTDMGVDAKPAPRGREKPRWSWVVNLGWSSIIHGLSVPGLGISQRLGESARLLEEAAACGDLDVVRLLLLELGDEPRRRDGGRWPAIHLAAGEGHQTVVELLSSAGTDVDAVGFLGTSPLSCAASGGHDFIVNLLLRAGANPLNRTLNGWTALHYAAFMGHSRVVQCLLEDGHARYGADWQDDDG
ncbi:putative ankyrin repeat domain-containing protein 52 [Rosellinia necatrix]|uniref:Putative ankyrin repeat domain-containing protein 52 n=1 Tax=Rosellinia necatrix TaxID=77044 RepID=A0A1W2TKT1_ROSNE|nr:putative ankyrin repeat domain-containing protein 52 [Rosellinia necatrix]